MEKTAVELFAGVGGFRVGLNQITEFDNVTGLARERERVIGDLFGPINGNLQKKHKAHIIVTPYVLEPRIPPTKTLL